MRNTIDDFRRSQIWGRRKNLFSGNDNRDCFHRVSVRDGSLLLGCYDLTLVIWCHLCHLVIKNNFKYNVFKINSAARSISSLPIVFRTTCSNTQPCSFLHVIAHMFRTALRNIAHVTCCVLMPSFNHASTASAWRAREV
jgi:hypothetical protein